MKVVCIKKYLSTNLKYELTYGKIYETLPKYTNDSTSSIKMYIGMLLFFLVLQTIVGFLATNQMKSQWILIFVAYFIEMYMTELKSLLI